MAEVSPISHYALESSAAEQNRLIRQAARLEPYTERFFRQAGIGAGQRVLDLGSGVGDVAMLAARLVGPTGEVVGIERDHDSIARARALAAEAGLPNVRFTQSDLPRIAGSGPFDAAVGRFILMYLPDPVAALRSVIEIVRPGGVIAFQEPSYAPFVLLSAPLPLWSAGVSLVRDTLQRSGANTEMGFALYRIFQEAGLPAPIMNLEMPLGTDPGFTAWVPDTLRSLAQKIRELGLSLESLGDLDTLPARLQGEIAESNTVVTWQAVVGAWSLRP